MLNKKSKFFKVSSAQTTVELLILLSVSMIALTIIFSLYINQLNQSYESQDYFLARASVQKLVSSVNLVYFSGPGSEIKVEVDFPSEMDFSSSGFYGSDLLIKLKNGNSYVGSVDVNVVGQFKPTTGKNVLYLSYDGNVVKINYNDYEINKQNISLSVVSGESTSSKIILRNNSNKLMKYYLDTNFNHDAVEMVLEEENSYFELMPAEIKEIEINFLSATFSQGNYSGLINIYGELDDVNLLKKIYLSIEVLTKKNELVIYPKLINLTTFPESIESINYLVCNNSFEELEINEWFIDGSVDNNAAEWLENLPESLSINSKDCNNFYLNFMIPQDTISGIYDANLIAVYGDNNTFTNIFIEVNEE